MSDELDRRAALAMGWRHEKGDLFEKQNGKPELVGNGYAYWSPSTDRNDLSELLSSILEKHLGFLLDKKIRPLWSGDRIAPAGTQMFWCLIADPAIVCEAACEVLEAANG